MDKQWFEIYAEKLKAIGHPVRLQLVIGLMQNECNVSKICKGLNIPQATTSQHLAILKSKGIIKGTRNGTSICYRIVDDGVREMIKQLVDFGDITCCGEEE